MPSTRELRLRVRSIKNLAQVTKALETVSASYVRRAVQAYENTCPYAEKAWKLLIHLARQPGHQHLHPLLAERKQLKHVLVVMIAGDRGLAGAYNLNVLRQTLARFGSSPLPVGYVAVGRKGRDLLIRRHCNVIADFSHLPNPPRFYDVSAVGRLVVDDFLKHQYDEVYLSYTRYDNRLTQTPVIRKLLPLHVEYNPDESVQDEMITHHKTNAVFAYEPDSSDLLDQIIPRFTALQIYQAILSAQASEHAARMVAMRNATENANELIGGLQLAYNKLRQNLITNEMLDIAGGAGA